jgi:hypothetical protein
MVLLSLSLASLILIVIVPLLGSSPVNVSISCFEPKEHAEYVIRVEIVLITVILLPIPLLEILLCSVLIIKFLLIWVAQTSKGLIDLFEGISGLRGPVFVRVEFKSQFFVSFFQRFLGSLALFDSKYLVIARL